MVVVKEADERQEQLHSLPLQGKMTRRLEGHTAELWVRAVQGLLPESTKFSLNVSLENLATNHNVRVWGKNQPYIHPLFQTPTEPTPCP